MCMCVAGVYLGKIAENESPLATEHEVLVERVPLTGRRQCVHLTFHPILPAEPSHLLHLPLGKWWWSYIILVVKCVYACLFCVHMCSYGVCVRECVSE